MKTKFIKGTNKKFSIREDGIVLTNYRVYKNGKKDYSYNVEIHPSNKHFSLYIGNGKRLGRTQNSLLKEYFNLVICVRCKEIKKPRKKDSLKCVECEKKRIKLRNKRHLKYIVEKNRKARIDLKDRYLINVLNRHLKKDMKIKIGDVPKELLETKRLQLKLHRELKKQKQNDTNK